ncbi:hypothetical protein A2767_07580 [Candidatus Roizmanbacteria bacterium RIFCSPHIGHO2_01_FULL_35_10]|uniref:AbiEi antitoxin C-terminal domain-containing protein n=1 Tax=Candidatus Roizmanbacteria bacterium RIFCSPLOWO2_01_FULL_35_13 TaxID=1802055 RepID=A0A1F7ICP2_9BACT|nr:MAG: hypothetical protein A2767_07580 [Candidatus Roizmanbacteria bacterium RIFCSPHIGHO2_01_FULL_35_10]OGK41128.1 MAG: hypothetical protein A3A74_02180 [Candidatus Roizmanbacteria bacterium RIFCSPLOWO2_01_FULL_35_13]
MIIRDLTKLSNLFFFSKNSLRALEKNEEKLNFNIKYWIKTGKIISLKNGLYITKSRWDKEINKDLYLEYLANKIYEPSYLSLEYIMNKYSLLTEAVYGITSITTKKTKSFVNGLASFNYSSMTPDLFTGYETTKAFDTFIFTASKAKAVFDYLYLRFIKNTPINKKIIEELRINWENITKSEFKNIEGYANKAKSLKVKQVISLIKKMYYAA